MENIQVIVKEERVGSRGPVEICSVHGVPSSD